MMRVTQVGRRFAGCNRGLARKTPKTCLSLFSTEQSGSKEEPAAPCDVVQGASQLRTPVPRPSPSLLALPGLRSLPFWTSLDSKTGTNRVAYQDPTLTPIVEYLEANVGTIRDEYLKVSDTLQSDYEDTDHSTQLHNGKWEWHSYMNKGTVQGPFAFRFHETTKILQKLRPENRLFEGTPFGFSFFSSLHGQSNIQAHTSPINFRVRLHLPLIVPDASGDDEIKCGIRVASQVREWTEGKAMILDDSYEHEVWNRTDEKRVLLLVDLWHPDVQEVEKAHIAKMFHDAKQQGLWKR